MKLSEFIRQQSDSVLADWKPRASDPPAADDNGCRWRLGYLPEILLAVADRVENDASDAARVLEGWARRHANERQAQNFSLTQVTEELRTLRLEVIGWWKTAHDLDVGAALDQVVRFTEAIDRALATAVACYDARLREASEEQDALNARLAQSEQRLRALVNASSHVVYRLSPDGTEMRELDGRGSVLDVRQPNRFWLDDYIHPDDQPLAMQAFQQAFRNRTLYEVEHRYRRVNGKLGWTLSRAVPLFDDEGRITEWFGAATDVTARRQVEETLREADRRKEEFLVTLGHELRNPLAPLRTCIDMLDEARRNPELLVTLRGMMDRQFSHLVRLVDDLLDISRISRGQVELQQAVLDLNEPIEAAIEQARGVIDERRHALKLALSAEALLIQGDAVRLTQVISNLLNNAAKYMEPGGTIHLSSGAEQGQAVIRVRDLGYGIAPEHFDKLFKLFTQIDEHRAQSGSTGLGVGLALSHQLVTLHGGTIEARSEGPGRGSEFTVRLKLTGQQRPDGSSEGSHEHEQ